MSIKAFSIVNVSNTYFVIDRHSHNNMSNKSLEVKSLCRPRSDNGE